MKFTNIMRYLMNKVNKGGNQLATYFVNDLQAPNVFVLTRHTAKSSRGHYLSAIATGRVELQLSIY